MGPFFRTKIFRKKFFYDAYFPEAFSHRRNRKSVFVKIHFNFCCVNTIGFLQGYFFEMKKFGEKFFSNAYFREVILVRDFCLF